MTNLWRGAAALAGAVLGGLVWSLPASSGAAADCTGIDLVEKLRAENPQDYAHLLEEADKIPNGKAIFWRIDPGKGIAPSWLLGTIHISDPRVNDLPAPVRDAFDKASSLALEINNLSKPNLLAGKLARIRHLYTMPSGQTLRDYLTKEEIDRIVELQPFHGTMHVEAMVRLQPWFIWIAISIPHCERVNLKAGKKALDARLEADALKAGKTVYGLETMRSQFEVLASIDMQDQVKNLKMTLRHLELGRNAFITTVNLYLARRMDIGSAMTKLMSRQAGISDAETERVMTKLVDDRNITQFEAAQPLIEAGNSFIAVGALHLPGKQGLVEKFKQAGYTVTPVN